MSYLVFKMPSDDYQLHLNLVFSIQTLFYFSEVEHASYGLLNVDTDVRIVDQLTELMHLRLECPVSVIRITKRELEYDDAADIPELYFCHIDEPFEQFDFDYLDGEYYALLRARAILKEYSWGQSSLSDIIDAFPAEGHANLTRFIDANTHILKTVELLKADIEQGLLDLEGKSRCIRKFNVWW